MPWQFWYEVVACMFGEFIHLPVPKAYVARQNERNGVLVEWFLDNHHLFKQGGEFMKMHIPDFDFKKGTQNNLKTLLEICQFLESHTIFQANWMEYLIKMFTFDALICNTDRHQDNWGFLIVAGVRHRSKLDLSILSEDDKVEFILENENINDPNAIMIHCNKMHIGYMNRCFAKRFREILLKRNIEAFIDRINGTKATPRLFLFVKVR